MQSKVSSPLSHADAAASAPSLPTIMGNVAAAFDAQEPEGAYTLDMAKPGHFQVWTILLFLFLTGHLQRLAGTTCHN